VIPTYARADFADGFSEVAEWAAENQEYVEGLTD